MSRHFLNQTSAQFPKEALVCFFWPLIYPNPAQTRHKIAFLQIQEPKSNRTAPKAHLSLG
jgi:hypothetical protein